ncbi:SCO6745 family protein [Amycolatopsis anabasis]|uniref:SCO6745 family protein n=1 Tax=Amycolatopsis anabasis TaxID=1840409 RepID=UPI00131D9F92|nr:hypothetical protein [Amycolatopsis anabasis]
MTGTESAVVIAREIRPIVQVWGGKFMTSPELAAAEREAGLNQRALYFRGRSAVLGDPSPAVVAQLFGIFPRWLFDFALPPAIEAIDAAGAVRAYSAASAAWSRAHLAEVPEAARLAELLTRLIDAADASGLALFAGWQAADRPEDDLARLGHALTVFREYRGGLHFATLRAVGLTVGEAVVADPEGGRARLLRTAWTPEAADELIARAEAKPDLRERWRRAEELTDERIGELLEETLDKDQRRELRELLGKLDGAVLP